MWDGRRDGKKEEEGEEGRRPFSLPSLFSRFFPVPSEEEEEEEKAATFASLGSLPSSLLRER